MSNLPAALPLLALLLARSLAAQDWMPGHGVDLLERAALARASRDADTVLAGWQASAHGIVRFTAEVDHGGGPIERVIRADELRVEVYGQAPNRSKQVILAWRDTTFQPTGIVYHRDHLGIIANDFGATIRLGEGQEVRDVPHPLSPSGLGWYQFRVGAALTVAAPSGIMRVVPVEVRPVDPESAGLVGTMLVDTDRAALVRLQFTFTGAAYRDPTVVNIAVHLENALHEGRWLPWRQSIAIRRAAPLVALPLATVIRADWTIDDYRLGVQHPANRFVGFAVEGPASPPHGQWDTPWTIQSDSLPATGLELTRVAKLATDMVPSGLLDGSPRLQLLASGGISRLVHINRVQGVSLGAGIRWRSPAGLTFDLAAGLGTADGRMTGEVTMSRSLGSLRVVAVGAREVRSVHEQRRRSGVANSLATLIDGSDAGDWYLSERLEAGIERHLSAGTVLRFGLRREHTASVPAAFTALGGQRHDNPSLGNGVATVTRGALSSIHADGQGWMLEVERGGGGRSGSWGRAALRAAGTLPARLEWRLLAGAGSRALPAHRGFAAGGVGSLPGTVPRAIGGRKLLQGELARPIDVDLPSPLGRRFGGQTLRSRVAPFIAAGVAWDSLAGVPWPAAGRLVPVVGIRLDLWGSLLRVEAGWAPRSGGFSLAVDAHPDWWPLL